MSRGINKVILVGNLGKDPEVRHSTSGGTVTSVSIATSESWKDKNTGEKQEKTEWHRVVFFGKLAEIAGEYLKKGSQVYLEGRLQTRKWQDKEGKDRYTTEIVADEMQMLGSREGRSNRAPDYDQGADNDYGHRASSTPSSRNTGGGSMPDDIPFFRASHRMVI